MANHLDNSFQRHGLYQIIVVAEHDVDGNFVENEVLVGDVGTIAQVEELQLIGPLELIVNLLVSMLE